MLSAWAGSLIVSLKYFFALSSKQIFLLITVLANNNPVKVLDIEPISKILDESILISFLSFVNE